MDRDQATPVPSDPARGPGRSVVERARSRLASLSAGVRSGQELVALGLSTLLLLVAVVYVLAALNLNRGTLERPGVGFFPTIVAVVLLVAAAADLVASLRHKADRPDTTAEVEADSNGGGFGEAAWRVPALLGLLVAYVVGIGLIGHLLTAAIVCTVVVRILGGTAWWKAVIAGFAVSWASVLVFDSLLGMRLPG